MNKYVDTYIQAFNKSANISPAVEGARAGELLGGLGLATGGLYGAISGASNPGYDEKGTKKSRTLEALRKALLYGSIGGGAGLIGGMGLGITAGERGWA